MFAQISCIGERQVHEPFQQRWSDVLWDTERSMIFFDCDTLWHAISTAIKSLKHHLEFDTKVGRTAEASEISSQNGVLLRKGTTVVI